MKHFRLLRADEIECRVSTVKKNGCSLLLYKDARCDQNILDEAFGIFGWERSHQLIGDRLYCTVSVRNPDTGEWIRKQDVGTESYTEKEKGQASDSFKRACFNLGIGRELYTSPFIWIGTDGCTIKEVNGRFTTYDHFSVSNIEYENDRVSYLTIINNSMGNKQVYSFGSANVKLDENKIKALRMQIEAAGVHEESITQRYKVKELNELTLEQWNKVMSVLQKQIDEGKNS